jgi:hypothetical protein
MSLTKAHSPSDQSAMKDKYDNTPKSRYEPGLDDTMRASTNFMQSRLNGEVEGGFGARSEMFNRSPNKGAR